MKALLCPKGLAQWYMLRFASGPSLLFLPKIIIKYSFIPLSRSQPKYTYTKSKLVLSVGRGLQNVMRVRLKYGK